MNRQVLKTTIEELKIDEFRKAVDFAYSSYREMKKELRKQNLEKYLDEE